MIPMEALIEQLRQPLQGVIGHLDLALESMARGVAGAADVLVARAEAHRLKDMLVDAERVLHKPKKPSTLVLNPERDNIDGHDEGEAQ